jgi:hypothetical protein
LGLKDGQNVRIEVMSRYDTTEAIANVNVRSKGYFRNLNDLVEAYPDGILGDRAYVGANAPYDIYEWDGNAQWFNTGEKGGSDAPIISTGATADTSDYDDIF